MHKTFDKPLWRSIADTLRDDIVSGQYHSLAKLPSDNLLVRRFKATRTTISKVMKHLEASGLVLRRPGSGTFINASDRADGAFVAALVGDLGAQAFFSSICAQIARSDSVFGLNLVWGEDSAINLLGDVEPTDLLIEHYRQRNIKGVFFIPNNRTESDRSNKNNLIVRKLTEAGISVVLIDRDIERFPLASTCDFVGVDNIDAGFRQVRHLYDAGARNIYFVGQIGDVTSILGRINGFETALKSYGLPYRHHVIRTASPASSSLARALKLKKADGIVCCNDGYAVAVASALIKCRVRIPEQVRIIGMDDQPICRLFTIPLSSMRQPTTDIADEAVRLMALRVNNDRHPPRRVLIPAELIVRASSRSGT